MLTQFLPTPSAFPFPYDTPWEITQHLCVIVNCRIGANAVLSPGTLLLPKTIVKRLQLIEQDPL